MLDLPGIIEGAASGRGKGRQVIAVGKSADLIIMMLDAQKGYEQKEKLTYELETTGIRLNREKPRITIKTTKTGGVHFNSAQKLTKIDSKMVCMIMQEYKIHNAHVNFHGDYDVEDLIDTIEGNRKYVKCIYVYNKIDTISIEDVEDRMLDPQNCCISVKEQFGIDLLIDKIWDQLGLVRVYTKPKKGAPDFEDPLILTMGRHGLTVKAAIMQLHKDLLKEFGYAYVWGRGCKHSPQKCGID